MTVGGSLSIKSGVLAFVFLLCASSFLGCGKDEPTASKDADFAARLKAAKQINVSSEKNIALEKLAANAAEAGNVEVVKGALEEMNVSEAKNNAAATAAELLSKGGNVDAAIEVARLINVTDLRNEVLAKIAAAK